MAWGLFFPFIFSISFFRRGILAFFIFSFSFPSSRFRLVVSGWLGGVCFYIYMHIYVDITLSRTGWLGKRDQFVANGFFLLFCFLTLTLTLTKVIHRLSCVIMV